MKNNPDVSIQVTTTVLGKTQPSLLERIKNTPIPDWLASVAHELKTLRSGKKDINGIPGEEALDLLPTDEGYKTHSFTWEAPGEIGKPLQPSITFQLDSGRKDANGNARAPSITNKQALQLYEQVVNSIRLRPTGPIKTSQAGPLNNGGPGNAQQANTPLPLGTTAASFSPCPQTGVWQCSDENAIGQQRRFFKQGQTMPLVEVVQPVVKGLGKWLGKSETLPKETMWALVAYQE